MWAPGKSGVPNAGWALGAQNGADNTWPQPVVTSADNSLNILELAQFVQRLGFKMKSLDNDNNYLRSLQWAHRNFTTSWLAQRFMVVFVFRRYQRRFCFSARLTFESRIWKNRISHFLKFRVFLPQIVKRKFDMCMCWKMLWKYLYIIDTVLDKWNMGT